MPQPVWASRTCEISASSFLLAASSDCSNSSHWLSAETGSQWHRAASSGFCRCCPALGSSGIFSIHRPTMTGAIAKSQMDNWSATAIADFTESQSRSWPLGQDGHKESQEVDSHPADAPSDCVLWPARRLSRSGSLVIPTVLPLGVCRQASS